MAVVDVKLVTGFSAREESLKMVRLMIHIEPNLLGCALSDDVLHIRRTVTNEKLHHL